MVIPNKLPMIETLLKSLLIITFLVVFWQDTRDRLVYWFLYPFIGCLAIGVQFLQIGYVTTLINSAINLVFILLLVSVCYLYSKIIMKRRFVNESIGLGDILIFIFLCFTFATVAFFILFVFALLFSLMLHLYFKKKSINNNVPLAGYIAVFFAAVYLVSFFIESKYLFAY